MAERPSMAGLRVSRTLLDAAGVERALLDVARGIAREAAPFALVGVRRGGLPLAQRLSAMIARETGQTPPVGAVDIALYRDDVFEGLPRPAIGVTELPFQLRGLTVVLVDDVLYTGRTTRAALDALLDHGRPRAVRLAVLVDRGLRELPIQADYLGLKVETRREEHVRVHDDAVVLYERAP